MPQIQIDIRCEPGAHYADIPSLKKIAQKILLELGWEKTTVNILLVSDRRMSVYNKRFLSHDGPTDVISFSNLEGGEVKTNFPYLGDLVISLDTTRRQAREYGNSFDYELAFYICHGILHLMGRSDKTKKQAAWMERKQRAVLKKIGVKNLKSK